MIQFNTSRSKWKRVSRANRCPICGKSDWCLITGDNDSPDAVICSRVESAKRIGTKGAGWLHRLRDDDQWKDRPRQRRVTIQALANQAISFDKMAAECESALGPHRRGLVAAELGVTVQSLDRLQVGWSERHRSFTFPMRDAYGNACGIRLRRLDGSKWAVKGSRQGLFVPRHFPIDDLLMICEGPTDTAAMLMLCFDAVGRPSCNGGVSQLIDLVKHHRTKQVVIIIDADAPGQRGADHLAYRLAAYVPDGVRIVTPLVDAKDAREWVCSGASRLDILEAIDAAPALQLTYAVKAVAQ